MKKAIFSKPAIIVIALLILNCVGNQSINAIEIDTLKKVSPTAHHEYPESEYIPVSRYDMDKSQAYRIDGSGYYTTQVNISEEGDNIVGDAANEPSIAISPTNPDKMVIGWRQFNTIQNSFRQAGYAYTTDGGETWTFPGVIDEGIFRSDPVLDSDMDGNIYYNSLTTDGNNYWCDVYKMEPGSTEWDDGTYALGGDKQWMVIDKTDGVGSGNIYASWTKSFSICYPDFFIRSIDGGDSYEDCIDVPGEPFWGTLATGPDGTLYAAGYSDFGFIVIKSTSAPDPGEDVSWGFFSSVDLDGNVSAREGPNPDGLLGQTWIGVDQSDGPNSGNIYLLCSVERNNGDPNDVMFARSTDGGATWDEPIRINQDLSTNNWQWFGTMSVALDGRIDVVWLDTRDVGPGSYPSSLYYSYSVDGGESFSANERISDAFNPHIGWPQQNKMGDYFHMISDVDYAHLAWANTLNGEQDTYYTRINPWFVGIDENEQKSQLMISAYPNPAINKITIRYNNKQQENVEIALFDMFGKELITVREDQKETGSQVFNINTSMLKNGIYFVRVTTGQKSGTAKIIVANK